MMDEGLAHGINLILEFDWQNTEAFKRIGGKFVQKIAIIMFISIETIKQYANFALICMKIYYVQPYTKGVTNVGLLHVLINGLY